MRSINYTIKSESELLGIVREAIEGGYTPLLLINGEYYDISLRYLMTDGDKCRWCNNKVCGLANITRDEHVLCNGTPDEIERCKRI